ncbi:MAG TPA: hypothetical protein VJ464_27175 [Blastocatellia bacterium]|nr:hypothetical protein [Blastocatellia bacterium]
MAGEFDKDFGYLMPFLDKVAAAAASLADPAARTELTRLIAEEKARWARIRELLGGASGRATTAPAATTAPTTTIAPTTPANPINPPAVASAAREPFSFTVGSLRPKRT